MSVPEAHVLSLDITPKGFAYAFMEGPERLVRCGHSQCRRKRDASVCISKVEELIEQLSPDLLVLEKWGPESRRSPAGKRLMDAIIKKAETLHLPVRKVSREEVRSVFAGFQKNKHQIALAISLWFPELEKKLPPERKPWQSESDRMALFDAVSFALTAYRDIPEDVIR